MGVRLIDNGRGTVAMYDSVSMWAFGPVMSSLDEAEAFLAWLGYGHGGRDPRSMRDGDLEQAFYDFQQARDQEHNAGIDDDARDERACDRGDA